MLERLKTLWRKIIPASQENYENAEPERVRAGWRRNRKYVSRREADRAYRERQKQKAEAVSKTAPVEHAAPEIILPAVTEASTPQSGEPPSSFPFSELRGLLRPGPHAKPLAQFAPPKVEAKPVELVRVAEPEVFEANATAILSAMAAQPIPETKSVSVDDSDDMRPVDPVEELRTDLPMRSGGRIKFLLENYETNMAMTLARIANDSARSQYERLRRGVAAPDVQAAIINPNFEFPAVITFVRR